MFLIYLENSMEYCESLHKSAKVSFSPNDLQHKQKSEKMSIGPSEAHYNYS